MLNDRLKELLIAIGIAAVVMVGISIKKSGSFFNSQAPNTVQGSKVQLSLIRSISLNEDAHYVTWSSDGMLMAAIYDIGTKISVWDNNGHLLRTIERNEGEGGYHGRIEFMPGTHIILGPSASGKDDPLLHAMALWNADTGQLLRVIDGTPGYARAAHSNVFDFALSPDGSYLAFEPMGKSGVLRIYATKDWSLLGQKQILRSDLPFDHSNDKEPPSSVQIVSTYAWSPANMLTIGFGFGTMFVSHAPPFANTEFIPSVKTGGDDRTIGHLAYSPDGKFLALGVINPTEDWDRKKLEASGHMTEQDKSDLAYVKVWDVMAKKFIAYDPTIEVTGGVRGLEWTSDGKYLFALILDSSPNLHVRVYQPQLSGGQVIGSFKIDGRAYAIGLSKSSNELAVLISKISGGPAIKIFKVLFNN